MMETASITAAAVPVVCNKLQPIDEMSEVCVIDTPFLRGNLQAIASENASQLPSESPSALSEKEDVISMLGESREASEEFRDSSISTLTANSRSTSLSSLTLSSNDHPRSNQIPQLKFLTHQNSIFLKKNSPRDAPRNAFEDSPSDSLNDSPSTLSITPSLLKSQSVSDIGTPPHHPIAKTLSFRTDSTGSLGSLLSNVEIPMGLPPRAGRNVSDEPHRDSFDSETGLPRRFNNRNVSSILITALKQSNRQAKKSVSFSIPSDDDIARKASKAKGLGMLYQPKTVDAFDDNIPDYQVISPKNSHDGGPKARLFASPTKDTPLVEAKQIIKNHKQEAASSTTNTSSNSNGHTSQRPPRPPAHSANVGMTTHLAQAQKQSSDRPSNGQTTNTTQISNRQHNLSPGTAKALDLVSEQNGHRNTDGEAAAEMAVEVPLMQRISQATSAAQLCEVFGISTESVFLGEMMKKRFSKDLLGKERHVWIEPRTKSIHWAKNAHDRQANVKVKYFLLDKNNPSLYISTAAASPAPTVISTSASPNPVPSPVPIFSAVSGEPNNSSSSSAGERIDTADTTSSNTIDGTAAASLVAGAAPLSDEEKEGESVSNNNNRKAQGQLMGIIHSATINHLSIRIQTESGDFLNLTIHSGKGSTQRAKDWFEVIKALTKDISPV